MARTDTDSTLSRTEQQLMAEMMQLVRQLDKKNVQGVYAMVADIVQAVSERKAQGLEAIAVLARGMDMLKSHAAAKRAERTARIQNVIRSATDLIVASMFFLAIAVIGFLVGFAGFPWGYYVAAAFIAFAILLFGFVLIVLWSAP